MSRSLSLLCAGALMLAACAKQEPTAPAPEPAADPAPIPATAAPAAASEPPAESSLALKRGTLTLATDQTTFQPCGEQTPLWVVDQTDGVLHQTFANESKPLALYVEAHGERTPSPTEMEAARAFRGAFILEEVLYAMTPDRSPSAASAGAQERPPAETQGCNEPAPAYIVRAGGNEPFWSVEVVEGKLIWRQPDAPQELVFEAVEAADAEGAVGYTGSAQGHALELFVEDQPCRDSMSGAYFAYSARATFDGKALKGCARIGE